ncbi:MAG TPA: hypothetical protein PLU43_04355, partial [Lachnospiraceae bacterium]|nr:hypothetical protein [Lachnospiraceae bacterium]
FDSWKLSCRQTRRKSFLPWIFSAAVLLLAVFAVSGLLSVSLSNDSMYYYSLYSKALVKFGTYRREFNVFLTDVGQGAALIGTLPYFFGFNETFGIQQFFNINFLCMFAYAVYEQALAAEGETAGPGRFIRRKRKAAVIAGLSVLVMLSSMPFVIVSKWVMANVYFMEYLFICGYLAYRFRPADQTVRENAAGMLLIEGLLIAVLSTLRMEGTIFVLLLVLCISVLPYKSRELAFCFLLPAAMMQLLYDIRIFLTMQIAAPYRFLTGEKALVQLAAMLAVLLYFLIVRGRFLKKLTEHMAAVIIAGLLLVNVGLCVLDWDIYIGNLEAFGANLFHQSGWGLFPAFVLAMLFLLMKKERSFHYFDLLTVGYLLTTLAVCWARDGVLREGVGDSGNRVLLQIIPLVVFALTRRTILWLKKD